MNRRTSSERGDDERSDGVVVTFDDSRSDIVGLMSRACDGAVDNRDLGSVDTDRLEIFVEIGGHVAADARQSTVISS